MDGNGGKVRNGLFSIRELGGKAKCVCVCVHRAAFGQAGRSGGKKVGFFPSSCLEECLSQMSLKIGSFA